MIPSEFKSRMHRLVEAVGGSAKAGEVCGVTRQTINLWLRGGGAPNKCTMTGAVYLLTEFTHPVRHMTPVFNDAQKTDNAIKGGAAGGGKTNFFRAAMANEEKKLRGHG